ncbi:MAG: succinylglutamate desuccinylase/aspartoacylase family protein, partial [Thermodesulfobacteriota bacterium]|nr:succinylglutamate desuccinylase/aspartoacylase family protein [Thermodesulfobacteriota bacterium]
SAISINQGPVVWLTACGHGDEICGAVIIHEIFKKIQKKLLCGAIHAFPLMNPIGFETTSRNITVSREDLNRSFPGDLTGTLGRRIANRIFSTIMNSVPTLVLDLHNDWTKSIPYVLIDYNIEKLNKEVYEKTRLFAKQTGFVVIMDTDLLTNTLSYNLLLNSVPALTIELGEPYVINEENVEFGLKSIWNILAYLEMIESIEDRFFYPLPKTHFIDKILKYSDKPYSSESGIIRFLARPGDEVKIGQPFAKVVNAFGKHQETIKAINNAIVLGHADSSVVFPGIPIMAFGIN